MLVDIALRMDISTVSNDLHDMDMEADCIAAVQWSCYVGCAVTASRVLRGAAHSNRAGYSVMPFFRVDDAFLLLSPTHQS